MRLAGCEVHSPAALSAYLPEFRRRHPAVQVTFQAMTAEEELAALRGETVHLCFSAGFGEPLDPAFATRVVSDIPLNVALPAGHPLAKRRGKQVDLQELGQEVFLSPTSIHAAAYTRRLDEVWERTVGTPRQVRATDGRENVLALVAAGYGVAVLPEVVGRTAPGCRIKRLRSSIGVYQLRAIWLRANPSRTLGHFLATVETLIRRNAAVAPLVIPAHQPSFSERRMAVAEAASTKPPARPGSRSCSVASTAMRAVEKSFTPPWPRHHSEGPRHEAAGPLPRQPHARSSGSGR